VTDRPSSVHSLDAWRRAAANSQARSDWRREQRRRRASRVGVALGALTLGGLGAGLFALLESPPW
jgi:hypothetical protein